MSNDSSFRDATDLVTMLAAGQVSAAALTAEAIDRIERDDAAVNAVVVRDFERARVDAAAADEALRRGERKPLLGLPVTLKESFDVAGLQTSWGLAAHRGAVAEVDSIVAARLRAAGAVILGKTNVSEGLANWHSTNPVYGTTVNPRHPDRTAGGSSGGSAAAVAAGFTALDVGSDLGGSIRIPAHFCGIYGHNSSGGLVPPRGHLLDGRIARADMSTPGPMARSARDLDLGLSVLAGPDDETPAYRLDLPPCRHDRLAGFRVLVLSRHPFVPTASDIQEAVEGVADRVSAAGATVRAAVGVIPDLEHLTETYLVLLGAALSQGRRIEDLRAWADSHDPADRSAAAIEARASLISHREWLEANEARAKLRRRWRAVFRDWDVVLCPPFPTAAPALAEAQAATVTIDGRVVPSGDQIAWCALATGVGLPATVMPAGQTREGLPVGVQIVGPAMEDRTTIGLAALLEQSFGPGAATLTKGSNS